MAKANEQPTELSIWNDSKKLEEIKGLVAQNLTNTEFQFLIQIGKSADLNPFLREIYAVKYGNAPASIFIGKNGYLKIANSHPNYDGHETEYIKDAKGAVIGCKATVYHKKRAHPVAVEVYRNEYDSAKSVWKEKPLTMIRKVALVQALRESFPEAFQGTYDESEDWNRQPKEEAIDVKPTPSPASPPAAKQAVAPKLPAPVPVQDIRRIEDLMRELSIPDEAQAKTWEMMKNPANVPIILAQLELKLRQQIEEMKEEAAPEPSETPQEPATEPERAEEAPATVEDAREASEGKQETSRLMEEVKALLMPSTSKTPLVQLEEAFARYCGKDIKPETATLTQWRIVKKALTEKRKEQEAATEAA